MATSAPQEESTTKRKIVLTIEEKLEIINLLQEGTSYTVITEKYGIGCNPSITRLCSWSFECCHLKYLSLFIFSSSSLSCSILYFERA